MTRDTRQLLAGLIVMLLLTFGQLAAYSAASWYLIVATDHTAIGAVIGIGGPLLVLFISSRIAPHVAAAAHVHPMTRVDVTKVKRGEIKRMLATPAYPSPALQAAIDRRRQLRRP